MIEPDQWIVERAASTSLLPPARIYLRRAIRYRRRVRIIDVPEIPPGAVRVYGTSYPLPQGAATDLGSVDDLRVAKGGSTLAVYRDRGRLRTVMRIDRAFIAALASERPVVFIALGSDDGATELVRWDLDRAFVEPLARVPSRFTDICAAPDASRIALANAREVVVCDGARGQVEWSRSVELGRVDHFALDGDTVSAFRSWYDEDEPGHFYVATRVRGSGPIDKQNGEGQHPAWYRPRPTGG